MKTPTPNKALLGIYLICLLSIVACSQVKQEEKKPLNIIFMMSDDHAWQAISAYDSTYIQTPNIDQLADQGAVFDKAFVTNSICAPARATLITGKFSHKNGHKDNASVFDGSQQTFPKILQQNGYQTAMVGKWHLQSLPTGFDYYNILPGQGRYNNPDFILNGDTLNHKGYVTDLTTDFAIDWLENQRNKEEPFCLIFNQKAPHRNWWPAPRHYNSFEDKQYPLPATFYDNYEGREAAAANEMSLENHFNTLYDAKIMSDQFDIKAWEHRWFNEEYNRMSETEKEVWKAAMVDETQEYISKLNDGEKQAELNYQRYMRDYLRTIKAVDENVGRLMNYLKEHNLLENTVIVYTSDQGFYLGEHGWYDKRWMYEQSHKTPLIIKHPDAKQSVHINQMVMNIDYAPTILDIAGVDVPEDMQGRSFKPMLENKEVEDWRDAVYYHYYEYPQPHHVNPHYGVRTDRYKLIRFYGDVKGYELYDLEKDPEEVHNVFDDEAYKEVQKMMLQKLEEEKKRYDDDTASI